MDKENVPIKITLEKRKKGGKRALLQRLTNERKNLITKLKQLNETIYNFNIVQESKKVNFKNNDIDQSDFQVEIGKKFDKLYHFAISEINENKNKTSDKN